MPRGLHIPTSASEWGFKGQNFLFTIGINDYEHWTPLRNAVKDVDEIVELLTSRYQFEMEHIVSLRDAEATEDGIREKLISVKRIISEDDNLIVFFSGHGFYDEDIEEGYWVPVDARVNKPSDYISNSDLLKWIRSIKTHHTLIMIDSCFSGTLVSQSRSAVLSEKYPSSRVFASGRKELVDDGEPGQNSPFAGAILGRLKHNSDRVMRASDLISHVTKQVESDSGQTPVEGRIKDAHDEGGEFVFHLKVTEEEIWQSVVASNTPEEYLKYIDYFPTGTYVHDARQLVRKLSDEDDWNRAHKVMSKLSLTEYLQSHPNGAHYNEARELLETLEEDELWRETSNRDALSGFLDYMKRYPNGRYVEEARRRIDMHSKDLRSTEKSEIDDIVQEAESKASGDEGQRADFKSAVEKAEGLFSTGAYKESITAYEFALGLHEPRFVPDRSFIMDRIRKANSAIDLNRLMTEGERAAKLGDHSAALERFSQAQKIEDSARVRDWISHIKSKLNQGASVTRGHDEHADDIESKKEPEKPKRKRRSLRIVISIGLFTIALGLVVVALVRSYDEPTYEYADTTVEAVEVPDYTNDEVDSRNAFSEVIVGNWMLADRIVYGQSARETGVLLEANYTFNRDGTFSYVVGNYPNTQLWDGTWYVERGRMLTLNVYGLGSFSGPVTEFNRRGFRWNSVEPDGMGGTAEIINTFRRQ